MARPFWRVVGLAGAGLAYGLLLLLLGATAAGAGHGTAVVFWVACSPFILSQSRLAVFGMPIFWAMIGALLGGMAHRIARSLFLATMIAHYAALPIILVLLILRNRFSDPPPAQAVGVAVLALALYAAGQLSIWVIFAKMLQGLAGRTWSGTKDWLWIAAFFVSLFLIPGLILSCYFLSLRDKE